MDADPDPNQELEAAYSEAVKFVQKEVCVLSPSPYDGARDSCILTPTLTPTLILQLTRYFCCPTVLHGSCVVVVWARNGLKVTLRVAFSVGGMMCSPVGQWIKVLNQRSLGF